MCVLNEHLLEFVNNFPGEDTRTFAFKMRVPLTEVNGELLLIFLGIL